MSGEPEWYLHLGAVRSRSSRPEGRWRDDLRGWGYNWTGMESAEFAEFVAVED